MTSSFVIFLIYNKFSLRLTGNFTWNSYENYLENQKNDFYKVPTEINFLN